jgi:CheY-like chemotaxis protein
MPDRKTILVIDDDAQLVDSVKTLLESAGYEVAYAYQAEKGVALAREVRPDLIVMDILFAGPPGRDGVEVSRQLAQDRELGDTPVILLSGVKSVLDMPVKLRPDKGYMPVQAFLEKPFKPGDLLSKIEQLLALRDSIREKGRGRILVVDDDPDFVQITSRILGTAGYETVAAANGAQALAEMRQQKPDLVLLDVMMSTVLAGLSVSKEMQADADLRDIPIVMISSIEGSQYAALLPDDAQIPVDAWISKPVEPEQLLGTVRGLLGN